MLVEEADEEMEANEEVKVDEEMDEDKEAWTTTSMPPAPCACRRGIIRPA